MKPKPTSGFAGVYWNAQRGKFFSKIQVANRSIHLGMFDTPADASAVYQWVKRRRKAAMGSRIIDCGDFLKVELTRGKFALVNHDALDVVRGRKWHAFRCEDKWYAKTNDNRGNTGLMHRLIMDAKPGVLVDHRNGDGLDNRRGNLRFADWVQNGVNRRKGVGRTSRYIGVHKAAALRKWTARVTVHRRAVHLGQFETEEGAARARDSYLRSRYGEFGTYNFPLPGERPATEGGLVDA